MPISEDKAKEFMKGYSVFGLKQNESPERPEEATKLLRQRVAEKIAMAPKQKKEM